MQKKGHRETNKKRTYEPNCHKHKIIKNKLQQTKALKIHYEGRTLVITFYGS